MELAVRPPNVACHNSNGSMRHRTVGPTGIFHLINGWDKIRVTEAVLMILHS